jgi:hypothetical protein
MSYVFDTSPLSTLFKNFYRNRFPSLWVLFDELVADGDIVSTREVWREIEDGATESLRDWAAQNQQLFTVPTAAEGAFVTRIYATPHFQQNMAVLEFASPPASHSLTSPLLLWKVSPGRIARSRRCSRLHRRQDPIGRRGLYLCPGRVTITVLPSSPLTILVTGFTAGSGAGGT